MPDNPFEADRIEKQASKIDARQLDKRIRDAQPVNDHPNGITNVPLDRVNPTDIQTANDLKRPEQYTALRREATMLGQMQPALEQGTNADTFDAWDKANRIGHYSPDQYVHGYNDVYHSYYGDEKIALEAKPNGTYDVINGRHRIAAARDAGLMTIPVKAQG